MRDVEFVGQHGRWPPPTLQEKIDLKLGSVYNPVDVQRAREKLKDPYEEEGYFEVQITPEVEKFGDGDVKVVFTINEGRRITIDRIVIRGNKGLTDKQIKDVMARAGAAVLHPARHRPAPEARRGHRPHRRPLPDHGYVQTRVESTRRGGRSREGPGDHHHRRGGGRPVPGRHDQAHRRDAGARRARSAASSGSRPATCSRRTALRDARARHRRPVQHHRPRLRRRAAPHGPAAEHHRPWTSSSRSPRARGLRRAHQHQRATPAARTRSCAARSPSWRAISSRSRRCSGPASAWSTWATSRRSTSTTPARHRQDADHRQRGGDRAAHRHLLHRRRLLLGGQLRRHPRHLPEQLPGPGLAAVATHPGRRQEPAGHHQLHRAVALRPAALGRASTSSTSSGSTPSTTTIRWAAPCGLSHPFQEYWRWQSAYRLTQGRHQQRARRRRPAAAGRGGHAHRPPPSRSASPATAATTSLLPTKGGLHVLTVDFAGLGGDSHFVKAIASTDLLLPDLARPHPVRARGEGRVRLSRAGAARSCRSSSASTSAARTPSGASSSGRSRPSTTSGIRSAAPPRCWATWSTSCPLPFNFRVAGFFDIGNVYGFNDEVRPDRYARGGRGGRALAVAVRADPGGLRRQPRPAQG